MQTTNAPHVKSWSPHTHLLFTVSPCVEIRCLHSNLIKYFRPETCILRRTYCRWIRNYTRAKVFNFERKSFGLEGSWSIVLIWFPEQSCLPRLASDEEASEIFDSSRLNSMLQFPSNNRRKNMATSIVPANDILDKKWQKITYEKHRKRVSLNVDIFTSLMFRATVLDYRQNLGLLSSKKTLTRPIDKIVKCPQLN